MKNLLNTLNKLRNVLESQTHNFFEKAVEEAVIIIKEDSWRLFKDYPVPYNTPFLAKLDNGEIVIALLHDGSIMEYRIDTLGGDALESPIREWKKMGLT